MYIYSSEKVCAYVYRCVHRETGKFYIGYRESNLRLNRPSHIDLPKYKTSSKIVKSNFNDYEWFIIAEFEDGKYAFEYEQQLINDHWDDPLLINKRCDVANQTKYRGTCIPWNKGLTKETDLRVAEYAKLCNSTKKDLTPWNKGLSGWQIPWNKGKTGLQTAWNKGIVGEKATFFNKKHTEESKKMMRKPKEKVICPNCHQVGGISQMKRWHFTNCKNII